MHTSQTRTKPRLAIQVFTAIIFFALSGIAPVKVLAQTAPNLTAVHDAMQKFIDAGEMSGALTLVVTKDKIVHQDVIGVGDISTKEPIKLNSLFWIASMTKPITAASILMLMDEGKLKITDPVAKFIPAFADLKTPSGKAANLTITQILTHTSGLGEASNDAIASSKTLADLIPLFLSAPMQYEPGAKWKYTQSGINVASRIVEVISGMSFDQFVQKRIFDPLGMLNTTFYPDTKPAVPRVIGYVKNKNTAVLEPVALPNIFGKEGHPPLGNGGLFSTGPDYARFCQMLLGNGTYNGKRYLSNEAMKLLMTVQTGDLPTGFIQNHEADYGWGIGTIILKKPHEGVAAMLSPGTYGHGGAWGTQAWIDPVRGVAYILMVQRPGINGDASELRAVFQQTAADALAGKK